MFAISGSVEFMRRVMGMLEFHMSVAKSKSCQVTCSKGHKYEEDSPLYGCQDHIIGFKSSACSMSFSNCREIDSGFRKVTLDKYNDTSYVTDGREYEVRVDKEVSILFDPMLFAITLAMRSDDTEDSIATLYLDEDSNVLSLSISEDMLMDEDGVFVDAPFEWAP